MPVISNSSGLY